MTQLQRGSLAFLSAIAGTFFSVFFAASAQALTVSPVLIDLEADPGDILEGAVTIYNSSEVPETYFVSLQNFVAQGEEGRQTFVEEENSFGLAKWTLPELSEITLQPNEERSIRYSVFFPDDAEPGGHYAALFFSTQPNEGEESSVGVGAKTGILLLARVSGDIRESATLETFRVVNEARLNRPPVEFEYRLRNTGNVHVRPSGYLTIRNMFGNVVEKVNVNPTNAAALPNSIRRIQTVWNKNASDGPADSFFEELRLEWINFSFGKYKASLEGVYGRSNQPLEGEVTFWIFPWRVISVGVASVLFLLLLLRGYNALIIRSALKKQK